MDVNTQFSNTISNKHRFGLGVIFALVIINLMALQLTIKQQKNDNHLVNIAGQQSMLSQKITLYLTRLAQSSDMQTRRQNLTILEAAITQFEQNHNQLTQTLPLANKQTFSDEIQRLYFEDSPSLNSDIIDFIFWARRTVEFGFDATLDEMPFSTIERLMTKLNSGVDTFEAAANNNLVKLEWVVTVLTIAMIIALIAQLIYVFNPLQRLITTAIAQLSSEKETARKLKEQAEFASEAKTLFMQNMSHELRTPLNGLFGMLELAIEQEGVIAKDTLIRNAKRSGNQLLRIINEILDISAIENREHTVKNSNFSITQIFDECLSPIAIICDQKHIQLEMDISEAIPENLYGAGNKLRQIINNLLNNAVKYTDHGTISFKAHCQLQQENVLLSIEIADTGIGMTKDQQSVIFSDYSPEDLTKHYNRAGLGLNIVSELTTLMDGELKLHSEYGRGSKFTIIVPFALAKAPSEQELEIVNFNNQYDLAHKKVAVVDDLATSRKLILHQLVALNVMAEIFSSGEELLKCDINQFDLFIIDLNMPGMGGEQVAEILKPKLSPLKNQKLILISASEDNLDAFQLKENLFDFHFSKPLQESKFFDTLITALSNDKLDHTPSNFHILVAEDNDINAHVAEQYLKSMGYKVSRVRDGQQAIDLCSDPNNQYDAILMDINMPKVDGYEATKVLREKLRLTIPIIALTANAFEEDIKKSLAIGMNKHLVKPFDKEDLQLVLRSLLAENETTN